MFLTFVSASFVMTGSRAVASLLAPRSCPTKATIFGDRDELLAEAHRRIAESPGKYLNRVWGESEVGGTSVLYISDIDLSFLTYGEHFGNKPLPQANRVAMGAVPFAFLGVGTAMTGLCWIIGRRMKLQTEHADEEGAPRRNKWKESGG